MNIMAGMMIPLTNWAPKLAWYSSSFLSANDCLDLLVPTEHLHQVVAR